MTALKFGGLDGKLHTASIESESLNWKNNTGSLSESRGGSVDLWQMWSISIIGNSMVQTQDDKQALATYILLVWTKLGKISLEGGEIKLIVR